MICTCLQKLKPLEVNMKSDSLLRTFMLTGGQVFRRLRGGYFHTFQSVEVSMVQT